MDNGPTAYFEDRRRGHGPSNTGGPKKTEKPKEHIVAWSLQIKCSPAETLILTP